MHNFKELLIWKMSMEFVCDVYRLTRNFPQEELFVLTSQMRRAAISIPSNISEGAGRNSAKEFLHFIDIASGSAFEIETQLYICQDLKYLKIDEFETILGKVQRIQKMIFKFKTSLIQKSKS